MQASIQSRLDGDYYAKVTINGVEHDNDGACNDETS
jgi:hypothetical protein